jgi:hypothetical protein
MKNCKLLLFVLVLLNVFVSFGQERIITGIVTENSGLPISGANVFVKGTKTRTQTGFDGQFSIKVKVGKKLVFSCIAYNNFELEIGKKVTNYSIVLYSNAVLLKETSTAISTEKIETPITGTVTDCEGIPLAGASISILRTHEFKYTGFDGKYSIIALENDILIYSTYGFKSQNIPINNRKLINAFLKESKTNNLPQVTIGKPIIYLYPTTKTDITLQLDFKGKLLTTFPEYKDKWDVTVYPDGRIFDKKTNRFYASLFWDGSQVFPQEHYNYKDGFVVVKKDLTSFLIQKLEFMGLNNNETNEFVQYWLPILEKNETNCIHFWVNTDYNTISRNVIAPKPETELRIFMEFYALDKTLKIPEQNLRKTERKGFTLVEWGGSDVSNAMNSIKLKI